MHVPRLSSSSSVSLRGKSGRRKGGKNNNNVEGKSQDTGEHSPGLQLASGLPGIATDAAPWR